MEVEVVKKVHVTLTEDEAKDLESYLSTNLGKPANVAPRAMPASTQKLQDYLSGALYGEES
jgi:hypothetical protein